MNQSYLAVGVSKATIIKEPDPRYACIFCHRTDLDEINLGPMYLYDGIVTHYFCMLFSAGLSQRGNDKDGILGFLADDVFKEVRRGTRLKCIYCHTVSATVGCCVTRCQAKFHYPCGLENDANFQFYGNFESFCVNHSRRRTVKLENGEAKCPICFSMIYDADKPVSGTCCKSAIFHKECMQKLALSAGYFFKCPTCNDQNSFTFEMKSQGIFVPEQDAAWEREPNAFQELLEQYNHCDAEDCSCPKGRDYGAAKGSWLLARCRICGAAGTHRQCGKLSTIANWACSSCLEVEIRTENERKVNGHDSTFKTGNKPKASKSVDKVKRSSSYMAAPTTNDEDVNLNQILIMPCCRDYFPHSKQTVQFYAKRNKGLPDWRMLELKVNLVDIFAPGPPPDGVKNDVKNSKLVTTNSMNGENSSSIPIKTSSSSKKRKSFKKGSRKRSSNWQKGVAAPRKKPQSEKKQKISISEDVDEGVNGVSVVDDDNLFKTPNNNPNPPEVEKFIPLTEKQDEVVVEENEDVKSQPVKEKPKSEAQTMAILAGLRGWVSLKTSTEKSNPVNEVNEDGGSVESRKRKIEDAIEDDSDKSQNQKRPFQVLLAANNNQGN